MKKWEVEIKTADQLPKIKASSYYGKYKPALIVDGNMKTAWRSKKGGKRGEREAVGEEKKYS